MAVDLTEFESLGTSKKECKAKRVMETLSNDDRANLEGALAVPHITNPTIVKWFRSRNISVGEHAIREHRKGTCCCVS